VVLADSCVRFWTRGPRSDHSSGRRPLALSRNTVRTGFRGPTQASVNSIGHSQSRLHSKVDTPQVRVAHSRVRISKTARAGQWHASCFGRVPWVGKTGAASFVSLRDEQVSIE
jgi:hypothetical protein